MKASIRIRHFLFPCLGITALGALSLPCPAQTGTFSLRTACNAEIEASSSSVSIALSPANCPTFTSANLQAGNLDVFACDTPGAVIGAPAVIAGVNAGGVLVQDYGASTGMYPSGADTMPSLAHILPATSTGAVSPLTITLTAASQSPGGYCYVAEYVPSANGQNVGLDTDGAYQPPNSGTSLTNINARLSGTSDVMFQGYLSASSYVSATSVARPYNVNAYMPGSGNGIGFSVALASRGAGATWTTAAPVVPILQQASWGWNPRPGLEQSFNDFEGGVAGNPVTNAGLTASHHGWQGGTWGQSGTMTWSPTNQPLLAATQRLSGDGISYTAGAGSEGVEETGTGSQVINNIFYSWYRSAIPSLTAAVWFCSDTDPTDLVTNLDAFLINSDGPDYTAVNFHHNGITMFFMLETVGGNSSTTVNYARGNGCAPQSAGGTGWVNIQQNYNFAGTHNLGIFVGSKITAATCASGRTTLTLSPMPANLASGQSVTVSGVTPLSWNGTFTDLTVSGSTIRYRQRCPASPYVSGGIIQAQVGLTMTAASAGTNYPSSITVGHIGSQALASGKHDYYDSLQLDLTGMFPIQWR